MAFRRLPPLAAAVPTTLVLLSIALHPAAVASNIPAARTAGYLEVTAYADASVTENAPTQNFGPAAYLAVCPVAGPDKAAFSLLSFDLANLPPGAAVLTATLQVNAIQSGQGKLTVAADAIVAPWEEATVTWGTMPPSAFYQDPAADLAVHGPQTVDVTHIVQAWATGQLPNNGIYLRPYDDLDTACRLLDSRESTNAQGWPYLSVQYNMADSPTATPTPTDIPTDTPTGTPTPTPTYSPTPTRTPTRTQTPTATRTPTTTPTATATHTPTLTPTTTSTTTTQAPPTATPTATPSGEIVYSWYLYLPLLTRGQ